MYCKTELPSQGVVVAPGVDEGVKFLERGPRPHFHQGGSKRTWRVSA